MLISVNQNTELEERAGERERTNFDQFMKIHETLNIQQLMKSYLIMKQQSTQLISAEQMKIKLKKLNLAFG